MYSINELMSFQNQDAALVNRKIALVRWKNLRDTISAHLTQISGQEKYVIFRARLHAYIVADGSISMYNEKKRPTATHHQIRFYPDHHSLIPLFIEAVEYLYLKTPKFTELHNFYVVRFSSQVACRDLLKIGKSKSLEWNVPRTLLCTKLAKCEWLRAFFDCEGYVNKRYIRIESVNESGIFQIQQLLKELGINSNTYRYVRKNKNWNVNYILCIARREDRQRYLNEIGFNHVLKQQKLQDSLASVR
jgi:hypothetical protein